MTAPHVWVFPANMATWCNYTMIISGFFSSALDPPYNILFLVSSLSLLCSAHLFSACNTIQWEICYDDMILECVSCCVWEPGALCVDSVREPYCDFHRPYRSGHSSCSFTFPSSILHTCLPTRSATPDPWVWPFLLWYVLTLPEFHRPFRCRFHFV